MDCHRTWEALLLGCIPIVKHNAGLLWPDPAAPIRLVASLPELPDPLHQGGQHADSAAYEPGGFQESVDKKDGMNPSVCIKPRFADMPPKRAARAPCSLLDGHTAQAQT